MWKMTNLIFYIHWFFHFLSLQRYIFLQNHKLKLIQKITSDFWRFLGFCKTLINRNNLWQLTIWFFLCIFFKSSRSVFLFFFPFFISTICLPKKVKTKILTRKNYQGYCLTAFYSSMENKCESHQEWLWQGIQI